MSMGKAFLKRRRETQMTEYADELQLDIADKLRERDPNDFRMRGPEQILGDEQIWTVSLGAVNTDSRPSLP